MKGFTNVHYAHHLQRGTREIGTLGSPKHAAACLLGNISSLTFVQDR